MAAHEHSVELNSSEPFDDYEAHRDTYLGFLALLKWSTIGIIIIVVLLAFFTL